MNWRRSSVAGWPRHVSPWQRALNGDRKLFVEALLLDGAVTDRIVAEVMVDEFLVAHRPNLPNFFAGEHLSGKVG